MKPAEQNDILRKHGTPGKRWDGIASKAGLKKALAVIRKEGRALSPSADGQAMRIAVPVFGPDSEVWAALGVSLPASRFRGKHRTTVVKKLEQAAEAMASGLLLAMETEPVTHD
jgi:DNA-binding IclR family transcriptional regulator